MKKYQANQFTSWIAHAHEFSKSEDIIRHIKRNTVELLIHPKYPRIVIDLDNDLLKQVKKNSKSIQLYFFSFIWLDIYLTNEENYDKQRTAIDKFLRPVLSFCEKNAQYSSNEMAWDDHALADRACVLIHLLEIVKSDNDKEIIQKHLSLLSANLDEILCSDKWDGNNHRVFHLCAKFCLEKFYNKNNKKVIFYLEMIESFLRELINVDTGLSTEQSISYYNFDIQLASLVSNFIKNTGVNFTFPIDELIYKQQEYLNVLAFPDGSYPASGDTPLGLKRVVTPIHEYRIESLWKNLEKQGHYRGKSSNGEFHYHLVQHNEESAHGHKSPLHLDLWVKDFGIILTDCGGPYKYGDSLRYSWFRTSKAHNTITFEKPKVNNESVIVENYYSRLNSVYKNDGNFLIRKLYFDNVAFYINDFIFSDSVWSLNYHFSPDIQLIQTGENIFEIHKNNKTLIIYFTLSESLSLSLYGGYITKGTGNKEQISSLSISGNSGIFEIMCSIGIKKD